MNSSLISLVNSGAVAAEHDGLLAVDVAVLDEEGDVKYVVHRPQLLPIVPAYVYTLQGLL